MRQIVLDTETTGLHIAEGHRIIEIGCLELVNRKLTGKRYHQYINPERIIDNGALAIHGITNEFLKEKPIFKDVARELIEFINGAELIIHNAPFDIGFLNYEFELTKHDWKPFSEYCHIIDTLIVARQLHVGQRNSLDALCKRYSIDNSQRELHGALLDAHLLAQVYLAMTGGQGSLFEEASTTDIERQEIQTLSKRKSISRNLQVLKASPEELAEHEKQLQKLFEKDQCQWLISAVQHPEQH